jgi:glycerol kinase
LEGSVFMGGATVQWLRDGLQLISDAAEVNVLAGSVPDSGGVILVPAFAGLGAPHWNADARGGILGLTRGSTDAHVARAALDGIACSVHDLLEAMEQDAHVTLRALRVDGGAAASDLLMQMQADLCNVPVLRPRMLETTAFGAAMAAALGAGLLDDPVHIANHCEIERTFEPDHDAEAVQRHLARWKRAVHRCRSLERD